MNHRCTQIRPDGLMAISDLCESVCICGSMLFVAQRWRFETEQDRSDYCGGLPCGVLRAGPASRQGNRREMPYPPAVFVARPTCNMPTLAVSLVCSPPRDRSLVGLSPD
jgi:hypothetical protein